MVPSLVFQILLAHLIPMIIPTTAGIHANIMPVAVGKLQYIMAARIVPIRMGEIAILHQPITSKNVS